MSRPGVTMEVSWREGEWDAARARVEEARAQVGDNAFLSFLAELELGCLRPVGR